MSDYLFVTDRVSPLSRDDEAMSAWGLARGLLAHKHRVTILTIAPASQAAMVPGLARRLRKVRVQTPEGSEELGLYEGQFSASDPQILVLESDSESTGDRALRLGGAAVSLAQDGLIKPEVIIGWGEVSVVAMARVSAGAKLFVLPHTEIATTFTPEQAEAVGLVNTDSRALCAYGASAAQAVIAPSRRLAKQLEDAPELAARPSDEPIVALQFGADEPPFDPSVDTALPTSYDVTKPTGKADARRALLKRLSISIDPRVPILGTLPRLEGQGGAALVRALENILTRDVLIVLPALGERKLIEKAAVLAIEHPTKLALLAKPSDEDLRLVLGACDAIWFLDEEDVTGRAAGRALRYGTLPLVPSRSAASDLFVEWDASSATGNVLFYGDPTAPALEATVARVSALKADSTAWNTLIVRLLATAPTWKKTASLLDALRTAAMEEADLKAVANSLI